MEKQITQGELLRHITKPSPNCISEREDYPTDGSNDAEPLRKYTDHAPSCTYWGTNDCSCNAAPAAREGAAPPDSEKRLAIDILSNCAYRYCHPEGHNLSPQEVIDCQIGIVTDMIAAYEATHERVATGEVRELRAKLETQLLKNRDAVNFCLEAERLQKAAEKLRDEYLETSQRIQGDFERAKTAYETCEAQLRMARGALAKAALPLEAILLAVDWELSPEVMTAVKEGVEAIRAALSSPQSSPAPSQEHWAEVALRHITSRVWDDEFIEQQQFESYLGWLISKLETICKAGPQSSGKGEEPKC